MSGNERVINSYAKALYEIGRENKIDVTKELIIFQELINNNNELETALFLDVFTYEEKAGVISDLAGQIKMSSFVLNFLLFLLEVRRFALFPQVFARVVAIDDDNKGFIKGIVQGNQEKIDESAMKKITSFLEEKINKNVKFDYQQNKEMSAGYKVTVGDLQLDASLENQLEKLKEEILSDRK